MRDREAVNRFCAFAILGWEHYRSGEMDSFLAEALESMNKMDNRELYELETRFMFAMKVNESLIQTACLQKISSRPKRADRSALNVALSRCLLCGAFLAR